ncbi:MAG TPA: hypothetical protein VJX67_15285 [Blastocatellia bacterium]|nr:hypothetical protein [Blastocatellia bacterium]
MACSLILFYVAFGCSVTLAQTPGISGPKTTLIPHSTAIVTAVLEKRFRVVDREKIRKANHPLLVRLPDRDGMTQVYSVTLPKMDYVVATLYRMRVDEVIRKDHKVKAGRFVDIVVPGWGSGEGDAGFLAGDKYLIFLTPLEAKPGQFAGTALYSGSIKGKERAFDPRGAYSVVWGNYGEVVLTRDTTALVEEIRVAAGKQR